MSINLPFVDEVRTTPRTILSHPLIKDLTRSFFHLLRGVVVLFLITTTLPITNLSELRPALSYIIRSGRATVYSL